MEIEHLAEGLCPVLTPLLSPFANGAILTLDSAGDYLVCACALPVGNLSYRSRRSQALLGHECLFPLSNNRIPSASARRWGAYVVRATPPAGQVLSLSSFGFKTGVVVTQNL